MSQTLTYKILASHLKYGNMVAGEEVGIHIDQTLTQDATGTMAWLQFAALDVPRVRTDLSVSYVDHNTLQTNFRNADDHRFLRTSASKFGALFSPAGTGVCHQLHLENFAKPGTTLIGADSHTPTAGGIGALAFGAGGLSVALAMAGRPYAIPMPKVRRVWLEGQLTGWASAKDVILYVLQKLSVKGGVGYVIEYAGPGVASLTVPERATITNMGAELGATTSVFPSDEETKSFLTAQGRAEDWKELSADEGAQYDDELRIDLGTIEPLAAAPHMPDKVVRVADLAGLEVSQVAIGSCTNSSYTDLQQVASILRGKAVHPATSTLMAPGSKQVLSMLATENALEELLMAGVRLLECSCGPCIGMGGAPASNTVTARTFNRNFEGRSGTKDAQSYLVSPITAAQVALNGAFTDPSTWGTAPQKPTLPKNIPSIKQLFVQPAPADTPVEVLYGPNIVPLEKFAPLPDQCQGKVVIVLEDNITTDHIMPAGTDILQLRSNIPAISEHTLTRCDPEFPQRARNTPNGVIIARENYGQGSSREHAAIAPRHLGIRCILACSFARIHRTNLVNFGIIPLLFANAADYEGITQDMPVSIDTTTLKAGQESTITIGDKVIPVVNDLSEQELVILRAGGLLNSIK